MFRVLALAITLTWLITSAAAACEPPPVAGARGAPGGVRTQTMEATPATPRATDPAACTVEPRTVEELQQLVVAGGQAARPAPEPTPVPLSALPAGVPADVETIAAITAASEQLMACLNAGDLLRAFALFSDDFVRTYAANLGFALEDTTELTTPAPVDEDEWTRLGEVAGARVLPDGRVGAIVIPAPPAEDEPVFFIFVQEGDRWLVDDFIEIEEESNDGAEPATPVTTWQPVQGEGYQGVIVPAADGAFFFQTFDGAGRAGYWTPTAQDIAELESAWQSLISLPPPPCGEHFFPEQIRQGLPDYHRQYVGFVAEDGRNLILINAFCTDAGLDWRSDPVMVLDGGACFFQITYDPASGDFSNLHVNGEA